MSVGFLSNLERDEISLLSCRSHMRRACFQRGYMHWFDRTLEQLEQVTCQAKLSSFMAASGIDVARVAEGGTLRATNSRIGCCFRLVFALLVAVCHPQQQPTA